MCRLCEGGSISLVHTNVTGDTTSHRLAHVAKRVEFLAVTPFPERIVNTLTSVFEFLHERISPDVLCKNFLQNSRRAIEFLLDSKEFASIISRETLCMFIEFNILSFFTKQIALGSKTDFIALILRLVQEETGVALDLALSWLFELADDPAIRVNISEVLPLLERESLVSSIVRHLTNAAKDDVTRQSARLRDLIRLLADLTIDSDATSIASAEYCKLVYSSVGAATTTTTSVGAGGNQGLSIFNLESARCEPLARLLIYFLRVGSVDSNGPQWLVAAYAAWALSNLAQQSAQVRDLYCESDVMQCIAELCKGPNAIARRIGALLLVEAEAKALSSPVHSMRKANDIIQMLFCNNDCRACNDRASGKEPGAKAQHTPTDAFGRITFPIGTTSSFIKVWTFFEMYNREVEINGTSMTQSATTIATNAIATAAITTTPAMDMMNESVLSIRLLLEQIWRLPAPNLVVILLDGCGSGDTNDMQFRHADFVRKLVKSCGVNNAWILSSGKNEGVVRLVGQAKAKFAREVPLIGIVDWSSVKSSQVFRNKAHSDADGFSLSNAGVSGKSANESNANTNSGNEIDPNHTHLIFVDDSSKGQPLPSLQLCELIQASLSVSNSERRKSRLSMFQDPLTEESMQGFSGDVLPSVIIVTQGDINLVQRVRKHREARHPIVLVAGSGRGADVLAAVALHMPDNQPSDNCSCGITATRCPHINAVLAEVFHDDIRQEEPLWTAMFVEEAVKAVAGYDRCLVHHLFLDRRDIHEDIINAAFSSVTDPIQRIMLTTRLKNGPALIQDITTLTKEIPWQSRQNIMEKLLLLGISLNNVTVIDYTLERATFSRLFQEERDTEERQREADMALSQLMEATYRSISSKSSQMEYLAEMLAEISQGRYLASSVYSNDALLQVILGQWCALSSFCLPGYDALFLRAVLMGRQEMSFCFWFRCSSPIKFALVAVALSQRLSKCSWLPQHVSLKYQRLETVYTILACDLIDLCWSQDAAETARFLNTRHEEGWGDASAMDLIFLSASTYRTEDIQSDKNHDDESVVKLLQHPCVVQNLNASWFGNIDVRNHSKLSVWIWIMLAVIMPIPFVLFVPWASSNITNHHRYMRKSSGLSYFVQRCHEFYSTPVAKYVVLMLLYSIFVIWETNILTALRSKSPHIIGQKYFLDIWVLTLIMEDIANLRSNKDSSLEQMSLSYSAIAQGKSRRNRRLRYIRNPWNVINAISISFYVVASFLLYFDCDETLYLQMFSISCVLFYSLIFRLLIGTSAVGSLIIVIGRMTAAILPWILIVTITLAAFSFGLQVTQWKGDSMYSGFQWVGDAPAMASGSFLQMLFSPFFTLFDGVDETAVAQSTVTYFIILCLMLVIVAIILSDLLIAIISQQYQNLTKAGVAYWQVENYNLLQIMKAQNLPPPFTVFKRIFQFCFWVANLLRVPTHKSSRAANNETELSRGPLNGNQQRESSAFQQNPTTSQSFFRQKIFEMLLGDDAEGLVSRQALMLTISTLFNALDRARTGYLTHHTFHVLLGELGLKDRFLLKEILTPIFKSNDHRISRTRLQIVCLQSDPFYYSPIQRLLNRAIRSSRQANAKMDQEHWDRQKLLDFECAMFDKFIEAKSVEKDHSLSCQTVGAKTIFDRATPTTTSPLLRPLLNMGAFDTKNPSPALLPTPISFPQVSHHGQHPFPPQSASRSARRAFANPAAARMSQTPGKLTLDIPQSARAHPLVSKLVPVRHSLHRWNSAGSITSNVSNGDKHSDNENDGEAEAAAIANRPFDELRRHVIEMAYQILEKEKRSIEPDKKALRRLAKALEKEHALTATAATGKNENSSEEMTKIQNELIRAQTQNMTLTAQLRNANLELDELQRNMMKDNRTVGAKSERSSKREDLHETTALKQQVASLNQQLDYLRAVTSKGDGGDEHVQIAQHLAKIKELQKNTVILTRKCERLEHSIEHHKEVCNLPFEGMSCGDSNTSRENLDDEECVQSSPFVAQLIRVPSKILSVKATFSAADCPVMIGNGPGGAHGYTVHHSSLASQHIKLVYDDESFFVENKHSDDISVVVDGFEITINSGGRSPALGVGNVVKLTDAVTMEVLQTSIENLVCIFKA